MKYGRYLTIPLAIAVLCAAVSISIFREVKKQTIADLNSRQFAHARQAATGIQDHFRHMVDVLKLLSLNDHIIHMDQNGKKTMTDVHAIHAIEIKSVTRMDARGRIMHVVPYNESSLGADISGQEHIRELMKTHSLVVSDVFTAVQGFRSVAIHMPVFRDGVFDGTIAFLISFDELAKNYLEDIRIGEDGYAWVLSQKGIELYDPVPGIVGKSIFEVGKDFPDLLAMAGEMLKGKEGVTSYHYYQIHDSGKEIVLKHAVYMPIRLGNTFWSIAVATPESEVTTLMEGFKEKLLLLIFILFIFCGVLTFFLIRALVVIGEEKKRRVVEEALRLEHLKLLDIIEFFPDAVFVIDGEKRVTAWNRAMEIMTGVGKDQVLGRADYEYAVPLFGERRPILIDLLDRARPEIEATYKYVKREGDAVYAESFVPKLNGGKGAHLWGVAVPLRDSEGRRYGAIEAIRDVSDMKSQEETLKRTVRSLRLLSQCNEAVIQARDEVPLLKEICRLVVQEAGYRMAWVGYADTGAGKHVRPVAYFGFADGYFDRVTITWDDSEQGQGPTGQVIRTGQIQKWSNIPDDPAYAPWRESADKRGYASSLALPLSMDGMTFGALNIHAGEPDAFSEEETSLIKELADNLSHGIMSLRARTERAEAIDALEQERAELEDRVLERTAELHLAKARAETADKIKSAFLATMSHELRTPLNSIIGFTGIILQGIVGPLNDEQKKQLGMVRNSAQHLLSLINDVLDISKIEAGQLQIGREPYNLHATLAKAVESTRPLAEKKGLALTWNLPPGTEAMIGDCRRVEQIMLNLISNAIKFTEKGSVRISGKREDGFITIRVADTGIGIKPEDMETIFKAFQQIDSGMTRKYEGTGLGLSICKRLTELMGGKIWATSVWGSGSTFHVSLPIEKNEV